MTDKEAERKRLAAALRANLKRRKAARPAPERASDGAPSMARDEAEGNAGPAPMPAQDGDRG